MLGTVSFKSCLLGRSDAERTEFLVRLGVTASLRDEGYTSEYATKFTDIYDMALGDGQEINYAWAKAHAMTEWTKPGEYGDVFASHYVKAREEQELNHADTIEYAKQQADNAQ